MPLDPNAYSSDSKPARWQEHQNYVSVPGFGVLPQKQNKDSLKDNYFGVHLTTNKEQAGAYAMMKSNPQDPPVVIELFRNKRRHEKKDIDANLSEQMFFDWIENNKSTITNIVKCEDILDFLNEEHDFYANDSDNEDPWAEKTHANSNIPMVLSDYLENMNEQDCEKHWALIKQYKIPTQLVIDHTRQYREMKPIYDDRVFAIKQYKSIALIPNDNAYQILESNDEDDILDMLEENEYTRSGDKLFDNEGREILTSESIENDWWLVQTAILFQNTQALKAGESIVYHGTSLSRAKLAYPDLIK